MKARWKQWSEQYAARPPREKWMLAVAALALAYALVDVVWLTPSINRWTSEQKMLAQKQADLQRLSAQVRVLEADLQRQAKQDQSAIAAGQRDLATLTDELARFEQTLVPARRMPEFLNGLLPGRGLEVVALKTLPPQPLVLRQSPAPAGAVAGKPAAPVTADHSAAPNLFKHGVEITLAGSFPALLEYLDRLEKSPQKLIFGRMELRADKYPRSELTLTLYTLSLDRSWLIV